MVAAVVVGVVLGTSGGGSDDDTVVAATDEGCADVVLISAGDDPVLNQTFEYLKADAGGRQVDWERVEFGQELPKQLAEDPTGSVGKAGPDEGVEKYFTSIDEAATDVGARIKGQGAAAVHRALEVRDPDDTGIVAAVLIGDPDRDTDDPRLDGVDGDGQGQGIGHRVDQDVSGLDENENLQAWRGKLVSVCLDGDAECAPQTPGDPEYDARRWRQFIADQLQEAPELGAEVPGRDDTHSGPAPRKNDVSGVDGDSDSSDQESSTERTEDNGADSRPAGDCSSTGPAGGAVGS